MKSWQLLPYDGYDWGFARKYQVGDTVRVITPTSLEYQKGGEVCNVTDLGVEVRERRRNTTVSRYLLTPITSANGIQCSLWSHHGFWN